MSEEKAGAQSSESAELGLGKKTSVPASSKEDWKIVTGIVAVVRCFYRGVLMKRHCFL